MNVAHRISGRGPRTVVLSNALGSTTRVWEAQRAALEAEFRVIRYDHRGHGDTPAGEPVESLADHAEDVLQMLDALGLERVSFAGVSMGGNIGMWLSAHAPERIDRLVIVCSAARFGEPQGWLDRAATVRASGTGSISAAIMERWFSASSRSAMPDVIEAFRRDFAAVDDGAYAACCEALAAWDFRAELGRIAAPSLVVGGRDDPAAPPEAVELVAAGIPGARLAIVDGAAHMANTEQPGTFTPVLLDFLREVS